MFNQIDGFIRKNKREPELTGELKVILHKKINYIELLDAVTEIGAVMEEKKRKQFFDYIDPLLLRFTNIEKLQEQIDEFLKTNGCECFQSDLSKFKGVVF